MTTYSLLLLVFVSGVTPVVRHIGNFSSAESCASAAKETEANLSSLHGIGMPGAIYRVLCVPASDGKAPPPN